MSFASINSCGVGAARLGFAEKNACGEVSSKSPREFCESADGDVLLMLLNSDAVDGQK